MQEVTFVAFLLQTVPITDILSDLRNDALDNELGGMADDMQPLS